MDHTNGDDAPLGLERGRVRLCDHSPGWHALYLREAAVIRAAMGETLIDIQHVGSTAIPAIKAKPIIDILAGARSLDAGLACREALERAGYDYAAHAGVPDDHVFGRGMARTHLLHIVEYGGPVWVGSLAFRDALLRDPMLAREYEALKIRLAERFADDRPSYTRAKGEFIGSVIERELGRGGSGRTAS